jgi:hypothetical protein
VTDERVIAKFLRGLTIGAILGAVVAGSRIWTRWTGRPRSVASDRQRHDDG